MLFHTIVMSTTYVRYSMNSLKSLKMKKTKRFLVSRETVKKTRMALEQETEKDFQEFARSRQNVRELAHKKYLD